MRTNDEVNEVDDEVDEVVDEDVDEEVYEVDKTVVLRTNDKGLSDVEEDADGVVEDDETIVATSTIDKSFVEGLSKNCLEGVENDNLEDDEVFKEVSDTEIPNMVCSEKCPDELDTISKDAHHQPTSINNDGKTSTQEDDLCCAKSFNSVIEFLDRDFNSRSVEEICCEKISRQKSKKTKKRRSIRRLFESPISVGHSCNTPEEPSNTDYVLFFNNTNSEFTSARDLLIKEGYDETQVHLALGLTCEIKLARHFLNVLIKRRH